MVSINKPWKSLSPVILLKCPNKGCSKASLSFLTIWCYMMLFFVFVFLQINRLDQERGYRLLPFLLELLVPLFQRLLQAILTWILVSGPLPQAIPGSLWAVTSGSCQSLVAETKMALEVEEMKLKMSYRRRNPRVGLLLTRTLTSMPTSSKLRLKWLLWYNGLANCRAVFW